MAVPLKDSDLVAFSTNFGTRITSAPATYGLTAAQATSYDAKHDAFIVSYNALIEARAAGTRSEAQTATKDEAKRQLLIIARELYGFVQDNTSVADAAKIELGVAIRDFQPTPVPPPADHPVIDVVSVSGNTVRLRLHDSASTGRAKPAGVKGAAVFSHIGANPPGVEQEWTFQGNTTKTVVDVAFPADTAAGAKVWFTAFWFNPTAQSGPAAPPISTNIAGGGAMAG